jgi:hypothetical protein
VEVLAAYPPTHAQVVLDGQEVEIEARTLVPDDVLVMSEGDRVCADTRIIRVIVGGSSPSGTLATDEPGRERRRGRLPPSSPKPRRRCPKFDDWVAASYRGVDMNSSEWLRLRCARLVSPCWSSHSYPRIASK